MGVDLIVCITGHVQDHLLANSYVDLRYARSGSHISDDPPILHKWIEGHGSESLNGRAARSSPLTSPGSGTRQR